MNLNGKAAVVTGASRGIGLAVGQALAGAGVDVLLVAQNEARLASVAKDLAINTGSRIEYLSLDLRRDDAPDVCMEVVRERFGHLDILVNNAGDTKRGDFFELSDQDWDDGFSLKVFGYVRMARAAWPLIEEAQGSIVNIIGSNARAGSAMFAIGGAANAALVNFTKTLADIGVSRGVRVNAINPGAIMTDRFESRIAYEAARNGGTRDGVIKEILDRYRVARIGQPEDVAHGVLYLVDDRAGYVQGAILDIDGGLNRAV